VNKFEGDAPRWLCSARRSASNMPRTQRWAPHGPSPGGWTMSCGVPRCPTGFGHRLPEAARTSSSPRPIWVNRLAESK
jgi:hypothetical protein